MDIPTHFDSLSEYVCTYVRFKKTLEMDLHTESQSAGIKK